MSPVAIEVEQIGKRYRIGSTERYKTMRDSIADLAKLPLRLTASLGRDRNTSAKQETFWALQDVTFQIAQGEVVGLIGLNGAGKSTLLKVLSRITSPTVGLALIHGRVGSLLEVGTGFHPELTGRDNVYLNGAILGMRRAEIRKRFDEIVAFAEVEKFIDTPVKHYSSGMHVRLAFAVAVHLETEVLLVDEVLSIGDAQFQKKCFEKVQQIGDSGRTIIFVSHNMASVRQVCSRGIVLHGGHVVDDGPISACVDRYLANLDAASQSGLVETASFSVDDVAIRSDEGIVIKTFDRVRISVRVTTKTEIGEPGLYVGILTSDNQRIAALDFRDFAAPPAMQAGESTTFVFDIESLPLLAGKYSLELHLKDIRRHHVEYVPGSFHFEVVETPVYGSRQLDSWFGSVGLKATASQVQLVSTGAKR
jgi:lipopolysaccharide transport system ATP-binding protein